MKRLSLFTVCMALVSNYGCDNRTLLQSSNITVAVDPPHQNIDIGVTKQFSAIVSGSDNKAVTWSLSGAGCADNGCGWLDEASGIYTAPDAPPNPPTFTVQAISLADPSKSGTGSVNITTTSNAGFVGHYAFLLNGFEASTSAVAIAAAFISDGQGNVTGGILDMNGSTGLQALTIDSGSYSYGADNRGRLVLNTPAGSFSFRYAMNAPNLSAQAGRIIAFQPDDPFTGSGVIKKQSAVSVFGDAFFGFGFSGDFTGGRAAAIGLLHIGPSAINGTMDLNLAGTPYRSLAVSGSCPSGCSTHDGYGRGTAHLDLVAPHPSMNLAFYMISESEAFLITLDQRLNEVPLLSGQALKQTSGPYLISGPLVFYLTGLMSPGTSVTIGRYVASGGTLVGVMDQNADTVITSNFPFSGSIANLDLSGHGDLNLIVGPTPLLHTFYLVAPNKAFLMEMQPNASEVGFGFMEAQSGTSFSNASLSGNYVLGTASPAHCGCTSFSGVARLNGGQIVGARDSSNAAGARDSLTGTFNVTSDFGRGAMTTNTPSTGTQNSAMYIVSSDKFVAIDVDPDVVFAVVTIFER
jgi:hypothetical protein